MESWEDHALRRPHLPDRASVYEVGPRDGLQNESETIPVEDRVALRRSPDRRGTARHRGGLVRLPAGGSAAGGHGGGLPAHPTGLPACGIPASFQTRKDSSGRSRPARWRSRFSPPRRRRSTGTTSTRGWTSRSSGSGPSSAAGERAEGSGCAGTCRPHSAVPTRGTSRPRRSARSSTSCSTSAWTRSRSATRSEWPRPPTSSKSSRRSTTRGSRAACSPCTFTTPGERRWPTSLRACSAGSRPSTPLRAASGGCPYAPGASGNLATEDLLYMLEGLGSRRE